MFHRINDCHVIRSRGGGQIAVKKTANSIGERKRTIFAGDFEKIRKTLISNEEGRWRESF